MLILEEGFDSGSYAGIFTDSWRQGTYDSASTNHKVSGSGSLRVHIPTGNHYGMDADYDPVDAGDVNQPVREMWASFWIRPDRAAGASDQIKLPGPERGEVFGGSTNIARNAFTAKMEHEVEGDTANFAYYAYHNDRSGSYGDYFPGSYSDRPTAPVDEWAKIGQHVKLNTVSGGSGNHDGILELWVNGEQYVNERAIEFTEAPHLGMHYAFVFYHGGSTSASSNINLYFDDFRVGTTDVGVGDRSSMPPSGGGGGGGGGGGSLTGGQTIIGYRTEQIGFDDIPPGLEPPPATVTVDAWVSDETWEQLNAMRDLREPFDISVGEYAFNDMGITDISRSSAGEQAVWRPAGPDGNNEMIHDVSITLQEHRISYVQAPANDDEDTNTDEDDSDVDFAAEYIEETFGSVPSPDTTATISLGEAGLADGDAIDPYLNEHFASGTRVEIPAGTYTHTGDWLGGSYEDAALVAAEDDAVVELEADEGVGTVRFDVPGGGDGSLEISNIRFTGERSGTPAAVAVGVASGSSAVFDRVRLPAGSTGNTTGLLVAPDATGTVYARNCYVDGFAGGGLRTAANATTHVQGGLYRNNNVAGIDPAGDTDMERVTIANDGPASPAGDAGLNQRGVWVHRPWRGFIRDSDFYHDVATGIMLGVDAGAAMTGTIENCRFTNLTTRRALRIQNTGVSTADCDLTTEGDGVATIDVYDVDTAGMACVSDPACSPADYSPPATDGGVAPDAAADGSGSPASIDPEPYFYSLTEVTATPDNPYRVALGDGDALTGTVIRVEDEADVTITATGSDWTIANVAIVGDLNQSHAPITVTVADGGTATIDTVYLPDGGPTTPLESKCAGITVGEAHAGTLTIRHANVQNFPAGGIRADQPGIPSGGGGTVTVESCYAKDNGVANIALGTATSTATDCAVYGDGTGPTLPTPPTNNSPTRAGLVAYRHGVTATDCNVYMGPEAGPAAATMYGGSLTVDGGGLSGGTTEGVDVMESTSSTASAAPPDGVPRSVVEAAP